MNESLIKQPKDLLSLCTEIRNSKNKYCKLFYLDKHKKLISVQTHNLANKEKVRIKDIFVPAFYLSATSVVMVHNHPNNSVYPYDVEINLTKESFTAGCFLGIDLIDHLIVTKNKYYSFHESKII